MHITADRNKEKLNLHLSQNIVELYMDDFVFQL